MDRNQRPYRKRFQAVAVGLVFLLGLIPMQQARAQTHTVSGIVTSGETGEPLPGVNIVVQGTTTGTTTDVEGTYTLVAPSPNDLLVFSFVGFVPQEVAIDGRAIVDVALEVDTGLLEEIVVVGYGTQARDDVTGAISRVSAEQIQEAPVASPTQALQGQVAGVTVTNTGAPGSDAQVRIRGLNSINSSGALFVVDGVPMGGLIGINPNDIQSIDVLKDASAASIYGSRAAGGVVLITTKQGVEGAPRVTFNAYAGVQTPWKQIDVLSTDEYIALNTEIQEAAGLPVPARFTDAAIRDVDVNYQDEVFRTAPVQNYDLGISGGTGQANYLVSLGYRNEQGTVVGGGFERYSLRVNTDFQLGPVRFAEAFSVSYRDRRDVNNNVLGLALRYPPYVVPRDPNNLGGFNGLDQVDNADDENPLRIQLLGDDDSSDLKLFGNLSAEVELLDGLTARTLVGMETNLSENYDFVPAYRTGDFHVQDFASISESRFTFFSPISTTTLNLDQQLGRHEVSAVGGFEVQTFYGRGLSGSGRNNLTSDIPVLGAVEDDDVSGSEFTDALVSGFGRVNYNYADRYLLQVALRRDGYSRFGPNNKYGLFPSASAGWNLAAEPFLASAEVLSLLKLRGSYGLVGNNNALSRYEYQPTVSLNYFYNFNGNLVPAATIPSLANEALRWETTRMANVGIDVGFRGGAIAFSAEYFNNVTDDILLAVPLPGSLGYDSSPRVNSGEVRNSGFEFTAGLNGGSGALSWGLDANLATSDNEVLSLGAGNPILTQNIQGDNIVRVVEGEPLFHFYGWQTDRLFQQDDFVAGPDGGLVLRDGIPVQGNAAPGDIKFVDSNGDGVIDADDRVNLGSPYPNFTYGFGGNLTFGGFDASLFVQGVSGGKVYREYAYWTEGMTRVFNGVAILADRWTPTNTDTDIPRGITGDPNRNARASDRFLDDASYLRLKRLTVGYTVPSSAVGFAERIRLYLQAENLLTFTGYDGFDPEIDDRIDRGGYPQARTILFGLQLGF